MTTEAMSRQELLRLPAAVKLPVAARALGLGRNKAYELVRAGRFPCTVLHLGNSYRVPTAGLLRLLGIEEAEDLRNAGHNGGSARGRPGG